MRYGFRHCAVAVILFVLTGCTRSVYNDDKPLVAASIPPLASIVADIAGDRMNVITVCGTDTDPETYEPTVEQRMRMSNVSAYFMVGHLPYESVLVRNLKSENAGLKVVDTSAGIKLISGTHMHSDDSGHVHEVDPHTWTSFANASVIAGTVCSALVGIDPDGAEYYKTNLGSLLNKIEIADSVVKKRLQSAPTSSFIVWHPSLSYFARDYNLTQVALGLESKEPTPARLHHAVEEARNHDAKVFFIQRQYDSRNAETINSYLKTKLVHINPLDSCWIEQIISIADELADP